MFNPLGGDPYEFIELQNTGPTGLDVGGYSLAGLDYVFPPGTQLSPGQLVVLSSALSPSSFTVRYPGVMVFGRFEGSLSNGGERLAVLDRDRRTVTSVDFDDADGWPAAADGDGSSLEILDPRGDPDAPANWRASATNLGTPGALTPPPAPAVVRLNEIMADNAGAVKDGTGATPDWIELRNDGEDDLSLAGWSLTDGSNPRKFVFPEGAKIPGGGFLVAWCDTNSVTGEFHTGFALDRGGETVSLHDAQTNRTDAVTLGVQVPDLTLGRAVDNDAWQLCQPTPGAANATEPLADVTNLVINEWLADALPGEDDWLELFNRDLTRPVALAGIYLSTSNAVFQVMSHSFLAPGGHLQLRADEKAGADHVDFKLPATGGLIALHDPQAVELGRVTYGPQTQGTSQGRLPDGSSQIESFEIPTPGAANRIILNQPPVLAPIADSTLIAGATLTFTNAVTDPDLPPQAMAFSLLNAPPGAAIGAASGVFTWRPTIGQSPATNLLAVRVIDAGDPPLEDTRSFTVIVTAPVTPQLVSTSLLGDVLRLSLSGDAGPDYTLQTSTNLTDWTSVLTTNPPALPFELLLPVSAETPLEFYRVLLGP